MSETLVHLAVLRALYEETGADRLEPFVPLVLGCIADQGIKQLDPDGLKELCDAFEVRYGLRVPPQPMMAIINRARKLGYIRFRSGAAYEPVPGKLAGLPFQGVREEQKAAWERTLRKFMSFADDMGQSLSERQADRALLSVLRDRDEAILTGSTGESILPPLDADDHEYLANSFIAWAYEADKDSFDFVVSFATGHLLASAVLNWNLHDYAGGLPGLHVYLDAPIILQLAGITVPARQEATVEFLALLRSLNVVLLVFEHSVQEAVSLLENAAEWIDNPRYDPLKNRSQTTRFVVDDGWTHGEVDDAIASLHGVLEEAGVSRRAAPGPAVLKQHQIDEAELERQIVENYRATNPSFSYPAVKPTILLDIKSVGAIHKLRKGRQSASLADANVVFATLNCQLARVVSKYERENETYGVRSIPTCVTEVFLGTLAWLTSPSQGAASNVRRVVADCTAALQPTPALVARMLAELKAMEARSEITPALYDAVRVDPTARRQLVELTQNDVAQFTAQTAFELIREYQDAHAAQVLAQFETEREKHRTTAQSLDDFQGHMEVIARRLAVGVGVVVFLVATAAFILADMFGDRSALARWVSAVIGALGFASIPFSVAAKGYVYQLTLQLLTPGSLRKSDEDDPNEPQPESSV